MLTVAIYDELKEQKPSVTGIIASAVKRRELPIREVFFINPRIRIENEDSLKDIDVFIFSAAAVDGALADCAKRIRALKSTAYIVFVTAAAKSNIQLLVRPSIGLSGLLFIPPERAAIYQTINEIAAERPAPTDEGEVFTVKSGSEYRKVPMRNIIYFQSLEKKIVLATDKQEIEFYSSLSAISSQVPEYFVRCYKSYIVNTKYIAAVDVSSMEISLDTGFRLPLSRQYKADFKRFIAGRAE